MRWEAIYRNGTKLQQFKSDGSENKYGDIDREKLVQFHLIRSDKPVIVVHLDQKKKLIYRRRVAMHIAGPAVGKRESVYLAGWQENRDGVNVQMVCFIFEDGHIEIVDRFYENHNWFYPVNFLPEERA